MSNEYTLYEDSFLGNLSIDEMSNKLSFNLDSPNNYQLQSSVPMSPEEMAKIMLEGLTVCGLFIETDIKALISKYFDMSEY